MPLGFIETEFVSVTAVVADMACKSGNVQLLGIEPAGTEQILLRFSGQSVSDLEAAVEAGRETSERLGVPARAWLVKGSPHPDLLKLNQSPLTINPLYGGREEMQPSDLPETTLRKRKNMKEAIGILETQGLTAALEATDAMLKSADVRLLGKEKIGAAYVTIMVAGNVAAVSAAIESGKAAVGNLGKLIAGHVIASPHNELIPLLPDVK
ncbi:MAG: BMC domain-containing protein [Puniceicoccaceae bacterium]